MTRKLRRLAINTGGGDCPGLNAVIRAVVMHAHASGVEVLGVEDGLDGLLPNKPAVVRPLTPEEVRPLLAQGGTMLGTTNRGDPFAYVEADGSVKDLSQALLARARELGIELLITVGGDGSQEIGLKLHALGLPVIGVPKTIDNDLDATVETFGFGTAVQVATDALDRLRTTGESHDRIMLLEVMGRDAGWIALHTGMAGGADVILVPELAYAPELVVRDLRKIFGAGRRSALIVVAEGAQSRSEGDGRPKARGAKVVAGAAQRAADAIAAALPGVELRVTVLGHVQRGGRADGARPAAGDAARRGGRRGGAARGVGGAGGLVSAGDPDRAAGERGAAGAARRSGGADPRARAGARDLVRRSLVAMVWRW
jgi:6-phosphofructokinase